jgi:hypothetical protein
MKKEAEEREKANELKQAKKLEREQRRLINEMKRRERESHENSNDDSDKQQEEAADIFSSPKHVEPRKKQGLVQTICSVLFNLTLLLVCVVVLCLALSTYCVSNKQDLKATYQWLSSVYLKPVVEAVDANVCQHLTTPAWKNILRKTNLI